MTFSSDSPCPSWDQLCSTVWSPLSMCVLSNVNMCECLCVCLFMCALLLFYTCTALCNWDKCFVMRMRSKIWVSGSIAAHVFQKEAVGLHSIKTTAATDHTVNTHTHKHRYAQTHSDINTNIMDLYLMVVSMLNCPSHALREQNNQCDAIKMQFIEWPLDVGVVSHFIFPIIPHILLFLLLLITKHRLKR